ncbi:short-chain fatty acid transporter [Archaeoglobales archaeon ex4484_92]|nr:MAG: short-chain fatty acid transporter [Archaeoglobales archaeon ex4484_92]
MISDLGEKFAISFRRWLPNPFTLAVILTILAFLLAWIITRKTGAEILASWYKGFWVMLQFTMQMVLIVVLAYAIGLSKPAESAFNRIASFIKTPNGVYFVATLVGLVLVYINWGLLILVGVFSYELARRVKGVDYRVLCAAVYGSSLIWHSGLSASAPLMMNTPSSIASWVKKGIVEGVVPVTETIFSPLNITATIVISLLVLAFVLLIAPKRVDEKWDLAKVMERVKIEERVEEEEVELYPSDRIDRSWILSVIVFVVGLVYIVAYFYKKGFAGLNLNSVNFILLIVGVILHKNLFNYLKAIRTSVVAAADVIIQFPFYAGIMGVFMFTGTATVIAKWFASFATPQTWPFIVFLTAAIVNIFIPSGGGEWMVLAPTILPATKMLGVDYGRIIMAYAYGDACTNMIQPFWAVIILSAMASRLPREMKIDAKDFMGYTAILCLLSFVVWSLIVTFFP